MSVLIVEQKQIRKINSSLRSLACVGITLLAMFGAVSSYAAAKIGEPAPAFSLVSANGDEVKLVDYAGKKVILEWTNHDCPFVKKHYGSGNMQSLQKRYTDNDVVWLSIISSAEGKQGYVTPEEANTLTASRNAMPTHVLFDTSGEVGKAYGAKTTPHMYVIDENGELKYNGAIDSIPSANPADIERADNYLELAMAALASDSAVEKPMTRPYGCSVKYK